MSALLAERVPLNLPESHPPVMLVVIDTEEEFDWSRPFDRANTSVEAMAAVGGGQALFDELGIRPCWVVDYPVAAQEAGWRPLREFVDSGRASIGAHLHPWVSPPHEEEVCARSSYPGNLPAALQEEKLRRLGEAIERAFGAPPTIYKAGRYGFGPQTTGVLERLGYEIDLSPCPGFDLSGDGGPDWSAFPAGPYRFGREGRLVGMPATGGFVGALSGGALAPALHRLAHRPPWVWGHAPGILARIGGLERLQLSPEGYRFEHLLRLTRALLARGVRLLSFTLHSPSLAPGHTPYVRDESDLKDLLATCRQYFEYFLGELGGATMGPAEARQLLVDSPPSPDHHSSNA